jgi:hypothetical protein
MSLLNQNKNIDKIIAVWSNFLNKEVFYVPILGPVYASGNSIQKLLSDVLNNSQTDNFLPYDKNKRWNKNKTERILLEEIIYNDKELYIPVKDTFKNILKIFYYSNNSFNDIATTKIKKIYTKTKTFQGSDSLHLYCFKEPKAKTKFTCQNVYLKNITSKDNLFRFPEEINYYDDLHDKVQLTFSDLKKKPELEGFGFLWKKFIAKNKKLSPIICAVLENKIVGAIGPLDIAKDTWNTSFLFPPYFGVVKKMRETGPRKKTLESRYELCLSKGRPIHSCSKHVEFARSPLL